MNQCLPERHPVCWDYSEVGEDFTGLGADFARLRDLLDSRDGEDYQDKESEEVVGESGSEGDV